MGSKDFRPAIPVTPDAIRALFRPLSRLHQLGATVKASSAEHGYEATQLIDGNPDTLWHTAWTGGVRGYPHEVTVDLQHPIVLRGFRLLPRQDANRNGWIRDVAVYVSDDGNNWGKPRIEATLSANRQWKTVQFPKPVKTRYVRVVAKHPINPKHPWASLAELDVLQE